MRTLKCKGCGGEIQVPELAVLDRQRLAAMRKGNPVALMAEIRRLSGWDLRESKGVMLHLTPAPRTCHRGCGEVLDTEFGPCPMCRRINIDWFAEPV